MQICTVLPPLTKEKEGGGQRREEGRTAFFIVCHSDDPVARPEEIQMGFQNCSPFLQHLRKQTPHLAEWITGRKSHPSQETGTI